MKRSEQLQCTVESLAYNFADDGGTGFVFMAPMNCCDMTGCIELFKQIDPHVNRIVTYAGNVADTSYEKDEAGNWHALPGRGSRGPVPPVTH